MSYRLSAFSDVRLDQAKLNLVIDEHERGRVPRFDTLWTYYRNPLQPVGVGRGPSGRWYRQPQEQGLPARLRTTAAHPLPDDRAERREVVIENDIAWRIQAMVDFMFGKPVAIRSTAREAKRTLIERVLDQVWEQSGGIALLQDIALMGHVFGHVDLLIRVDEDRLARTAAAPADADAALAAASAITIEVVEPRRGIPLQNPHDYRLLDAYIIRSRAAQTDNTDPALSLRGVFRALTGKPGSTPTHTQPQVLEVISASAWHVYHNGALAWEQSRAWTAGRIPVVHIQNTAQPLTFEGAGEVEPLIPLQDELNTRLSDRANRVTLQSFKMYLAKGIEGLHHVGPDQIWSTDNLQATVEAFGGDANCPSEESHIREVREALDKVSGVPPLSGGVVQGRIGNLTSATALRITLMGLTAKTNRKRVTYGRGIAQACELILAVLDTAGVLQTDPSERTIALDWPDPLPADIQDTVAAAQLREAVGVPASEIARDLRIGATDHGVQ